MKEELGNGAPAGEVSKIVNLDGLGTGFENTTSLEKTKFVSILSGNSSAVSELGCAPGSFFITGEDIAVAPPLCFIPLRYSPCYTLWSGHVKDQSTKFLGRVSTGVVDSLLEKNAIIKDGFNQYRFAGKEYSLTETHLLNMLVHVSEGRHSEAIFSVSGARISPFRDLITKMRCQRVREGMWSGHPNDEVLRMFLQIWQLDSVNDVSGNGVKFWNLGTKGRASAKFFGEVSQAFYSSHIEKIVRSAKLDGGMIKHAIMDAMPEEETVVSVSSVPQAHQYVDRSAATNPNQIGRDVSHNWS